MSGIDWIVLFTSIVFIVVYGIWKSRGAQNIEAYLLADKQLPWYQVGLSVMATQASAITFLSAPGQAYSDGLRFIQFYFGLPLAMIVLCTTFIPIFRTLNVYTAYEYLEKRFDNKTRSFTAFLFLLQRGLSTGITIYAPSIILSTILNIDIRITTLFTGGIVILYTVYGGTKAVSYTQMFQMAIIFAGLLVAGTMVVHLMPAHVGFVDALHIAGKMNRLNAIDTTFDWNNRYNIWSGLIGGFFLQLSYFGTDQSQVGRYLTGKSTTESRLGLVMNGLIKIPMQFLILLIGTLVFAFYQYQTPPVFFNRVEIERIKNTEYAAQYMQLENAYQEAYKEKPAHADQLLDAIHSKDNTAIRAAQQRLLEADAQTEAIRGEAIALMKTQHASMETNDSNYVFLDFVTTYLPVGLVGLLVAIILLASMGSTASGLNSLASTSIVDFYKRFIQKDATELNYLQASRWATVGWGLFCVVVALYAGRLGNLIEAVNILGSLFYGVILGIFLVAFFVKYVKGTAVFYASIVGEIFVVAAWYYGTAAFLWLNVLGCLLVMLLAVLFQAIINATGQKI
jgi:SSS family solute:Na+ symporter